MVRPLGRVLRKVQQPHPGGVHPRLLRVDRGLALLGAAQRAAVAAPHRVLRLLDDPRLRRPRPHAAPQRHPLPHRRLHSDDEGHLPARQEEISDAAAHAQTRYIMSYHIRNL